MILKENLVTRIANSNPSRHQINIQNTSSTTTNYVYILAKEAEEIVFLNHGIIIGGLGHLEIDCSGIDGYKGEFYAYTNVSGGIDIRVLDI